MSTRQQVERWSFLARNGGSSLSGGGANVFISSRNGVSNPLWRTQTSRNQQAGTPYTAELVQSLVRKPGRAAASGTLDIPFHPNPNVYVSSFSGTLSQTAAAHQPLSGKELEVLAAARSKFYRRLAELQQELNGPTAVAELVDTVKFLLNPFGGVVRMTNYYLDQLREKRKGLKGPHAYKRQQWEKVVANGYIEYAFGLSPLISDTEAIAKALARMMLEETGKRIRSRSFVEKSTVSHGGNDILPGSLIVCNLLTELHTTYRVQLIGHAGGSISGPVGSVERLKGLCGFRPENWIPAAWEVVPWSWLIDYFVNIGDILNAAALSSSKVNWLVETTIRQTDFTGNWIINAPATLQQLKSRNYSLKSSVSGTGPVNVTRRTTIQRTLPTSVGIPPLVVEHPFGNFKKVLNMAGVVMSRRSESSNYWMY